MLAVGVGVSPVFMGGINADISGGPAAPVLSNGVASNPPQWDSVMANLLDGDTIELSFTVDGSAPDDTADDTHTAVPTDEQIGWPTLGLITGGTTVKVKERYGRGGVWSAWSNTLTIGPIATWTPAAYFLSNTVGAIPPSGMFFAPAATNCYTDTAATTLVSAVGQAVAYIKDLSGNSIDMAQNTLANRPLYQTTTGVFGTGLPYLSFDGSNDMLQSGGPVWGSVAQPVFSGHSVKPATSAGTIQITDGIVGSDRNAIFQDSTGWGMSAGTGVVSTPAAGTTDTIITALFSGASSYLRKAGVQTANLSAGTNAPTGITVGAAYNSSTFWNGRWYGGFRIPANPSATLRTLLEAWLTGIHP